MQLGRSRIQHMSSDKACKHENKECEEDTELYLEKCCELDGEGEEDDDGQPIW